MICNYSFRAFSCEIALDLDLEHRCGFHTPFRCLLTTLPINIEDKNLRRHFSDCISELRWSKYYGNTGVEFSREGYKIRNVFWLKINCSQMKSLNFANWWNRKVSKSAEIWLSKSILMSKIIWIILIFFHWRTWV